MSDYTKIVDYAAKDALLTGNPAKLVKGTEIGAEFDAIVTAVATKVDETGGAATNLTLTTPILGTPQSGTVTNLTGTASININGTVGATTPEAGSFTTLGSNSTTTLNGTTIPASKTLVVTTDIGTSVQAYDADIPTVSASQGEMEAGTEAALRSMSPLRVAQAIAALGGGGTQIQPIAASVGSNALTISASALSLEFRSATLGSGTVSSVSGTPANLVISSGSTLGTVSAVQSRIAVLALNNAGTIELAAVNISGGVDLTETGVISTTAEGGAGAADSATVVYSTTARSNLAYRVIGYIESTQATAGTWATAPSTIQGAGGNAVTAMSSLGYGQTWQDVAGSRALSTTYYNTTGRPIFVAVTATITNAGNQLDFTINGVLLRGGSAYTATAFSSAAGIVPHGGSYSAVAVSGGSISKWAELR